MPAIGRREFGSRNFEFRTCHGLTKHTEKRSAAYHGVRKRTGKRPAATCHGEARSREAGSTKPRSGGIFIAWGVSPRNQMTHMDKPWRGDRLRLRREPQSSFSDCLSPLRGSIYLGPGVPGAHAPGYESVAPSALRGCIVITSNDPSLRQQSRLRR